MRLDDETERELRHALAPVSAYFVATRALTGRRIGLDEVVLLARIAQRITLPVLIQLARETGDWCAWLPLLLVVLQGRRQLKDVDLRVAEHNLRLLGRRLLDAQGFERVRLEDVMAHPPRLQRAAQEMVTFGPGRR